MTNSELESVWIHDVDLIPSKHHEYKGNNLDEEEEPDHHQGNLDPIKTSEQ